MIDASFGRAYSYCYEMKHQDLQCSDCDAANVIFAHAMAIALAFPDNRSGL